MKREEMNRQMKDKILNSALKEFNEKDYNQASLNNICKIGKISKGIIYHYFDDKDDLYLACVQDCYDKIISYYNDHELDINDIKSYMKLRIQYFDQYPESKGIFFNSLLKAPKHLKEHISKIREPFITINLKYYEKFLSSMHLRENIDVDFAVKYFDMMQNSFNDFFIEEFEDNKEVDALIEKHEKMITMVVDLMLYGIVKE